MAWIEGVALLAAAMGLPGVAWDGAAAGQSGIEQSDLARPRPIGGIAQWLSATDYPPAALRAGAQGRTVADLTIDATGRVTDCVIRQSSGSSDLDAKTCEIAKRRATFTPAHDAQGRAIAGSYVLPIRWQLPAAAAPAPAPATTLVSIGPDGAVLSCTAVPGVAPLGDLCGAFPTGRKLDVPEALRGKVVAVMTAVRALAE